MVELFAVINGKLDIEYSMQKLATDFRLNLLQVDI